MQWLGRISERTGHLLEKAFSKADDLMGYPPSISQDDMTPDTALNVLKEFNSDGRVLAAMEKTRGKGPDKRGEFLKSFAFAQQEINPAQIVNLARYLNTSKVFNEVAPEFYGSTTWNNVLFPMIDKCPEGSGPELLGELESKQHLQKVVTATGLDGGMATLVYFDKLMKGKETADAIQLLKRSPSFQIVKQGLYFADSVQNNYPQYKSFLE